MSISQGRENVIGKLKTRKKEILHIFEKHARNKWQYCWQKCVVCFCLFFGSNTSRKRHKIRFLIFKYNRQHNSSSGRNVDWLVYMSTWKWIPNLTCTGIRLLRTIFTNMRHPLALINKRGHIFPNYFKHINYKSKSSQIKSVPSTVWLIHTVQYSTVQSGENSLHSSQRPETGADT